MREIQNLKLIYINSYIN